MPLIDPQLKEILVCPCQDHAPLDEDEAASRLHCPKCHRSFAVEDGLPIMLLDETEIDHAFYQSQSADSN